MTYRSFGISLNQQRILVAILFYRDQMQKMAAFFALGPKSAFAATEKSYLAGLEGFIEGLLIHKAEHQHLTGDMILYYGGNQAAHFSKIGFHRYSLTVMPSFFK
jgi:hypothetical protein